MALTRAPARRQTYESQQTVSPAESTLGHRGSLSGPYTCLSTRRLSEASNRSSAFALAAEFQPATPDPDRTECADCVLVSFSSHCADTTSELPRLIAERRAVVADRGCGLQALDATLARLERHLQANRPAWPSSPPEPHAAMPRPPSPIPRLLMSCRPGRASTSWGDQGAAKRNVLAIGSKVAWSLSRPLVVGDAKRNM